MSRQHMGLIIATGTSVGMLFVVPIAYSLLARDHHAEGVAPAPAPTSPVVAQPTA